MCYVLAAGQVSHPMIGLPLGIIVPHTHTFVVVVVVVVVVWVFVDMHFLHRAGCEPCQRTQLTQCV
jgi:hypothetical protein